MSVAQLLDSVNLELPDTTTFREYDYKVGYRPESIYSPSIGYAQDNYGQGLYGGAGVVLTDLLGDNQVVLAGQVVHQQVVPIELGVTGITALTSTNALTLTIGTW